MWPPSLLLAFLCGSIPFGLLIARSRGIDIRAHGSKNIGATNVGRVLGRKFGLLCFALDALKGFGPTFAAGRFMHAAGRADLPASEASWWLGVMAAAILGHMFSPWVGFKGGKGVATGLGAMLGVYPVLTIAGAGAFAVWLAAMALWRYVSLASCLAAGALPVLSWLALRATRGEAWMTPGAAPFFAFTGALAALVIYKHRSNIARLLAGTEPKLGQRRNAK
jgi:acyl phosphate:glycerol-3-phosphate acyltransferase